MHLRGWARGIPGLDSITFGAIPGPSPHPSVHAVVPPTVAHVKPSQDHALADNRCSLPNQVTGSRLFAGAVRPTTKSAPEGTNSVSKMVRSPCVPEPIFSPLVQAFRTIIIFADTASKDPSQSGRDGSGHPRDVSGREPWRIILWLTRVCSEIRG